MLQGSFPSLISISLINLKIYSVFFWVFLLVFLGFFSVGISSMRFSAMESPCWQELQGSLNSDLEEYDRCTYVT